MAQMIVLYKTPKDTTVFDREYAATHIPLAKKIPGLRKYEVSKGPVTTPFGSSPYHLVATLHFDSMLAMQAAFASLEGREAGAHAGSLADLDILLFENHEV
ncbi:MAG: EthD family reductase [Acidobacteriaceae bacterium]